MRFQSYSQAEELNSDLYIKDTKLLLRYFKNL